MKFLIVALSALALASAQTTTVKVGLSIKGKTDGSATIRIGNNAAFTLPAAVVSGAKNVIGLFNTIASGVTTNSNLNTNVAVTSNSATGAISATVAGKTITLTKNTIPTVLGLVRDFKRAVVAAFPRGPKKDGKSHKESNEKKSRKESNEKKSHKESNEKKSRKESNEKKSRKESNEKKN